MRFSFLTYNTLFNNGIIGLKKIINQYQPDIICLQEVNTDEENLKQFEKLNYKIADFSNYSIKFGKIFGMATFYNQEKFSLKNSKIIPIPHSLLDWIIHLFKVIKKESLNRSFLKTELIEKKSNKKLIIYNTHLTVFGSNNARIKQIKKVLKKTEIKKKDSLIIAGDFNYFPYGRKNLEKLMKNFGFKEATKNISYTITYNRNLKKLHYNFILRIIVKSFRSLFTDKLKIDYIFYKNLIFKETKRIDINYSDHYPIISIFYI